MSEDIYTMDKVLTEDQKNYASLSEDLRYLLRKIDIENFKKKFRNTLNTIESAINMSHAAKDICIAFNGGKDCCVVLYIFYRILFTANQQPNNKKLNILMMELSPQFGELVQFVQNLLENFYDASKLSLIHLKEKNKSMKECLQEFKSTHPSIIYILMGTRRTDNAYYKNLSEFADTDATWPYFVRVNPILDWNYSELWYFIRRFNVPYCSLYDQGYTSLGDPHNTIQNKALYDEENKCYRPAYYLDNETNERNSRI